LAIFLVFLAAFLGALGFLAAFFVDLRALRTRLLRGARFLVDFLGAIMEIVENRFNYWIFTIMDGQKRMSMARK